MDPAKPPSRRGRIIGIVMAIVACSGIGAKAQEPPKPPALGDAQKDRLKDRDQLRERASRLRAQGKFAEAIEAIEAKLAIEREVLGESSDEALGSLESLAGLQEVRGDWAASASTWRRAEAIHLGSRGADHWRTIDARFAAERAEAALRLDALGQRRLTEASALGTRVAALYGRGLYAEAESAAASVARPRSRADRRAAPRDDPEPQ